MLSAVLFDLDDTLTDRSASLERYARVLERDFRERLADVTSSALLRVLRVADEGGYHRGRRSQRLLERLRWRRPPARSELDAHALESWPACCVARDGLLELLDLLRAERVPLGVVTNGTESQQNAKLDVIGVRDRLDVVVISESAEVEKPDASIFAAAITELRVPAVSSWFVGDHPTNDVEGARDAGLLPVWLRGMHRWPPGLAEPEIAIDRLPELAAHVTRARAPAPLAAEADAGSVRAGIGDREPG